MRNSGVLAATILIACALSGGYQAELLGQEVPRSYEAERWSGTSIEVDGRMDEPAWVGSTWTGAFVDIRDASFPDPTWSTRAKILWDDQYLYIGASLEEPHLWATLTQRDAIIYHDHDFEVFLDPDGDGLEYYELEINALGTEFDLFLDKPYNQGGRAFIDWDMPGLRSAVDLDGTLNDARDEDQGWSVEVAIPWADLSPPGRNDSSPPSPGDVWRVNFSRVQWPLAREGNGYLKTVEATPELPHPEDNWVWSPQGVVNMHVPEKWGFVRFVGSHLAPRVSR